MQIHKSKGGIMSYILMVIFMAVSFFSVAKAEDPVSTSTPVVAAVASHLEVEIKFGTGIEKRDLVGESNSFDETVTQVVGWTRIKGAKEPIEITHVWLQNGVEKMTIPLAVNSANFRTFSRKTISGMVGPWALQVKDATGHVLAEKSFTITKGTPNKSPTQ
jgi:hypothetical protein